MVLAVTERPRASASNTGARHVPAEVRRTVWARDGGQCRFEGPHGRCRETGLLEFHHVVPYAAGGLTTSDNLELRCAAHNRYEAEQYFRLGMPMSVREERGHEFGEAALLGPDRAQCSGLNAPCNSELELSRGAARPA